MRIPQTDANHFIKVYQELMRRVGALEGNDPANLLENRAAVYQSKHLAKPPTDDEDLLAALKTAVYGQFIVGRHLARYTEMVGPKNQVFRVAGLTDEPGDIIPPWMLVHTAVMQFRGHWICDGLFASRNIAIGSNMRRDLTELISESTPATAPQRAKDRTAEKTGSKNKKVQKTAKRRPSAKIPRDEHREKRIATGILANAAGEAERALCWYDYLAEKLRFPFGAECVQKRHTSPLKKGEEVRVMDLAPEEECEREVFVEIRWEQRKLAVPLSQLEVLDKDKATREAVEDWHYWTGLGNRF